MKTLFPLSGAVLIIAFAFTSALGCECQRMLSIEEEMARSDLIFSGEVTRIDPSERDSEIVFRPSSIWKGSKTDLIALRTTNPGRACGFEFMKGRQYLVYASVDDTGFRTSTCTRTKPEEYAYDDIEKLTDHGWSRPVNGLRARISLIPAYYGGFPIYHVFIEMENVADTMGQRTIRFDPARLDLRVVNESGNEVPAVEPMYNGFAPTWKETLIPHGGTIKFKVSFPGSGYLQRDSIAIDLGTTFRIWRLQPGVSYFVTAKLTIPAKKEDHPFLDWSGTLEMPMVVIRADYARPLQSKPGL